MLCKSLSLVFSSAKEFWIFFNEVIILAIFSLAIFLLIASKKLITAVTLLSTLSISLIDLLISALILAELASLAIEDKSSKLLCTLSNDVCDSLKFNLILSKVLFKDSLEVFIKVQVFSAFWDILFKPLVIDGMVLWTSSKYVLKFDELLFILLSIFLIALIFLSIAIIEFFNLIILSLFLSTSYPKSFNEENAVSLTVVIKFDVIWFTRVLCATPVILPATGLAFVLTLYIISGFVGFSDKTLVKSSEKSSGISIIA